MSMVPAKLPNTLVIDQGATFRRTLTLKDKATGVPLDLTGKTFKMQGRATIDSPTVVFEMAGSCGAGGTIPLHMTKTVTAALAGKASGYLDLEIVTAGADGGDDEVDRPIYGEYYVRPEVTRG